MTTSNFPTSAPDATEVINGQFIYATDINPRIADVKAITDYLGYSPAIKYNFLINGGFDFYHLLLAPATLTTVATDKYGPDRWRCSSQSASFQVAQGDASAASGLTSQYYGTFKQITNAGKFMVYQILTANTSMSLKGKSINFQMKMKGSGAKTIRMAIIELAAAGTADTIPATFVTSWNANTADPTLGANLAVVTGAESKSVTTAWVNYQVDVIAPSDSKNFICAVWTDSQFSAWT